MLKTYKNVRCRFFFFKNILDHVITRLDRDVLNFKSFKTSPKPSLRHILQRIPLSFLLSLLFLYCLILHFSVINSIFFFFFYFFLFFFIFFVVVVNFILWNLFSFYFTWRVSSKEEILDSLRKFTLTHLFLMHLFSTSWKVVNNH